MSFSLWLFFKLQNEWHKFTSSVLWSRCFLSLQGLILHWHRFCKRCPSSCWHSNLRYQNVLYKQPWKVFKMVIVHKYITRPKKTKHISYKVKKKKKWKKWFSVQPSKIQISVSSATHHMLSFLLTVVFINCIIIKNLQSHWYRMVWYSIIDNRIGSVTSPMVNRVILMIINEVIYFKTYWKKLYDKAVVF